MIYLVLIEGSEGAYRYAAYNATTLAFIAWITTEEPRDQLLPPEGVTLPPPPPYG